MANNIYRSEKKGENNMVNNNICLQNAEVSALSQHQLKKYDGTLHQLQTFSIIIHLLHLLAGKHLCP